MSQNPRSRVPDSVRRGRVLLRRHGPTAPIWRRRCAIFGGAIAVGLVAISFAALADRASDLFGDVSRIYWWLPLLITPTGYVAIAWVTIRFAPDSRGSGIPQIIAATHDPEDATRSLASLKTAAVKIVLTAGALACGNTKLAIRTIRSCKALRSSNVS